MNRKSCLPEKLSTFVGREKEINTIKSSLVKDRAIVSLIGGPGFGKSSIAVEVSHHLSEEHGIPVIFSYLSTTSTVAEVARRLCLDVGVQPGEDPKSSLMVWLRNINRRVVLVLDNVEQLLEGETILKEFKNLLRLLIKDSSQFLQIITTSRKSFQVADLESECCLVEAMDVESSVELLKKLCPRNDLRRDDLVKMIELCGHIPLALRLLSFRLKHTEDPAQLVEWLQETPMEVLQTPDKKVRNAIEKSFETLQNEDKSHFVRLSALEGNFNCEAAKHVTELVEINTENLLAELVERSLLQRSGGNYSIQPLVRNYLTEMEEFSEERKRAQGLMVEHFLRKCHQLTLSYWSKDGSNAARKALEEILHHVEKVLKICEEASSETNPTNTVIITTLVNSEIYKSSSRFFHHFIVHILSPVLVRNFHASCAKLAKKRKDVVAELHFECLLADQIGRSTGWKSDKYNNSMELAKQTFDQIEPDQQENSELSHFYYCYGRYQHNRECTSEAKKFLQKSLEIRQRETQAGTEKNENQTDHEQKVDQVLTLTLLGKVCRSKKDTREGLDYYRQALTMSNECLGDHELTLSCHKQSGDIELQNGDYEKAPEYYDTAMGIHKVLTKGITDASISSVFLLKNRGSCLFNLRRYQGAVDDLKEACGIIEKRPENNDTCKFQVYSYLAEALNGQAVGCPEAAEYAEKALQVKKSRKWTGCNKKSISFEKKKMDAIIVQRRKQDGN